VYGPKRSDPAPQESDAWLPIQLQAWGRYYLKLARESQRNFEDRYHFFAIAAQAMRRILVDHARAKQAARRGGGELPLNLDLLAIASPATTNSFSRWTLRWPNSRAATRASVG
jgi:ECF sigma factor